MTIYLDIPKYRGQPNGDEKCEDEIETSDDEDREIYWLEKYEEE